jgi:hypothetical protein
MHKRYAAVNATIRYEKYFGRGLKCWLRTLNWRFGCFNGRSNESIELGIIYALNRPKRICVACHGGHCVQREARGTRGASLFRSIYIFTPHQQHSIPLVNFSIPFNRHLRTVFSDVMHYLWVYFNRRVFLN